MNSVLLIQLLPVCTFLMLAAGFVGFWCFNQQFLSALIFAAAAANCAVSFATIGFTDAQVQPWLYFSGELGFLIASVLVYFGICFRYKYRVMWIYTATVVLVSTSAAAWYFFVVPDVLARLIIISLAIAAILALAAYVTKQVAHFHIDKILFWLISFLAAIVCLDAILLPRLLDIAPIGQSLSGSVLFGIIGFVSSLMAPAIAIVLLFSYGIVLIRELESQSQTDILSGLLNRRGFSQRAEEIMLEAQKAAQTCAIIVSDIDNFKSINDSYGHPVGDKVIRTIGNFLKEAARDQGLAGRVGGDEFCLLLTNTSELAAMQVAEEIRQNVIQSNRLGERELPLISASFGVAQTRQGENYDRLFSRADAALFLAKDGGRNRVASASGRYMEGFVDDERASCGAPTAIQKRLVGNAA